MTDQRSQAMPKTIPYGEGVDSASADPERLVAPAAERNLPHLIDLLASVLGEAPSGRALEVASGTGQQAVAFARAFPGLDWQPSDVVDEALASIRAWTRSEPNAAIHDPLVLDLMHADWHRDLEPGYRLMLAVNLIHISPWPVTLNLLDGAARLLSGDGRLVLYSPMIRHGDYVSDGNRGFDESLQHRAAPKQGVDVV
ncbi:MAG: DUF938 domain-containing protein, partial [Pseudomonadota bacterium]